MSGTDEDGHQTTAHPGHTKGNKMSSLYELIQNAIEELKDDIKDGNEFDENDRIHELADSWTPIYYSEILSLAADNLDLATDEPELGPAFDGSPTPINIIAANIYEAIYNGVWEFWSEEGEELYNEKHS